MKKPLSAFELSVIKNNASKVDAANRLASIAAQNTFNKKNGVRVPHVEGAPSRKPAARLAARRADWQRMVDQSSFKAPMGAYHRPGSMSA